MGVPLLTLVFFVFLTAAILLAGRNLTKYSLPNFSQPHFVFGVSFILGTALFTAIWRLTELLVGSLRLSLLLSFVAIALFSVPNIQHMSRKIIWVKQTHRATGLALIFCICIIGYWLRFDPSSVEAWAHIGSLHTGRYSNLALYMWQQNRIPVVGQNFEQSLLASTALFVGLNRPGLGLSVLLCFSQVALGLLLFGLFQMVGCSKRVSLLGIILTLFGQSSLSLSHVIVFDSISPIGFAGYSDSVRSVASFLIFGFLLQEMWFEKRADLKKLLVVVLFWFSWGISAPQNILLCLCILFGLSVLRMFKRKAIFNRFLGLLLLGLLLTWTIRPLGGLFCPTRFREPIESPGLLNAWEHPREANKFRFEPQVPSYVGDEYVPSLVRDWGPRIENPILSWVYLAETQVWLGLRTVFFSLLGILLLFLQKRTRDQSTLLHLAMITFLVGGFVTFLFSINGVRWQWTRLMMPGYTFASACLVVAINLLQFNRLLFSKKWVWLSIAILTLFGPMISLGSRWQEHLANPKVFFRKVSILINLNETLKVLTPIRGY